MKNYKLILIVVGTIFAVVFATFLYSKSVENKAIVLEESISESKSAINKEEQRRVDLFCSTWCRSSDVSNQGKGKCITRRIQEYYAGYLLFICS